VYLTQQMRDLNQNYKTRDENGVWTTFTNSNAEFIRFNEEGYMECFLRGKLLYVAEVPCDSVNDGSFSFTLEMCNQVLNYSNCINLYNEIIHPKPKTYMGSVIGSICYRRFNTQYPLRTKCGPRFSGYEVIPSMYMFDGKFKSPTLLEFRTDFELRKNTTYYNISASTVENLDGPITGENSDPDPDNFWKKRSVNHTHTP